MSNLIQIPNLDPHTIASAGGFREVPSLFPKLNDMKIAFVAEAPGAVENKVGEPLVGPSGKLFNYFRDSVGIPRASCYIGNVCRFQPPNNDISYYQKADSKEHWRWLEGIKKLKADLEIYKPNVICALGGEALEVLTGKPSIVNYRGSILPCTLVPGLKVVGTYHPAMILREYSLYLEFVLDLQKVKVQAQFPDIRYPKRKHNVLLEFDKAMETLEMLKTRPQWSNDIESSYNKILCIGWSDDPERSYILPFYGPPELCQDLERRSIWNLQQEVELIRKVQEVQQSPAHKCGQNYMFDRYMMAFIWKIITTGMTDDTMIASKIIHPELAKGLDSLVSYYTDEPYYKDDGKAWRTPEKLDFWKFWNYNGLDCCCTEEVRGKQKGEIDQKGLRKIYDAMIKYQDPLLLMSLRGILKDKIKEREHLARTQNGVDNLQKLLEGVLGTPINVASPKQMKWLLYEGMGLPPVTKMGRVTTDEDALVSLSNKTKDPLFPVIQGIRKYRKELTYVEIPTDRDGRIRCIFNSATETGRLSCSTAPSGSGCNMQTVPVWARDMCLPDPGYILGYSDLQRAEAKVVAYLCGDPKMIASFDDPNFDIHSFNSCMIFGYEYETFLARVNAKEQEAIDERYLTKRGVHAANYGIGWRRLQMLLAANGFNFSAAQCKDFLARYFAAFPAIPAWHREIQRELGRDRTLTTPFGRKRTFYGRWDDSTFREAYAFKPQSIVADITRCGIQRVYEEHEPRIQLQLQVHDAIVFQVKAEDKEWAEKTVKECMTMPVEINGRVCTIGVDCHFGVNWKECK